MLLLLRLRKIIVIITLFFLGITIPYTVNGADKSIHKVLVEYDFNKMTNYSPWTGWSLKPQKIELVKVNGRTILQYTTSTNWNTPIIPLHPPITITATTALQFRIKVSKSGDWEINLQNATEGAEYSMLFSVARPNKWTNITAILKEAAYKRGGKGGIKKDGIIGDKISQIQLAYRGKNIQIANFRIVELNPMAVGEFCVDNPAIKAYKDTYKKVNYPKLARNSVFPFGVILTLNRSCRDNAEFFDQTLLDRYKAALLDIKMRGFNTVSNFCNSVKTGDNLELMKKYHLFLFDTVTCGSKIYALPDNASQLKAVEKYSFHPNLLAWYGQDEPTNIKKYLKNKKRVETISAGGAPYVSAMHMNYIVKNVGPCMEVIAIDPYNLTDDFNAKNSSQILLNHSNNIEFARNSSMMNRVWMIPQAFGMRSAGKRTLRYPRPKEARLEVFNALASGVKGFIFFIYNETVPYLDKQVRGEEFDQTMVDAWYNGNPTTDELSKLAKRLIPVIPSFLDTVPCTGFKTYCSSKDVYVKQLKNQYGTLIYCYNTNLAKNIRGQLKVKLPSNVKLYDIESLKTVKYNKFKFNLASGDGNILFAAKSDKFAVIAKEINFHRAEFTWQQLDVKLKRLAAAGFDTAELRGKLESLKPEMDKAVPSLNDIAKEITNLRNSNTEYCQISGKLTDIQKAFGRINAILTNSKKIKQIDCNSKWYGLFDSIKKLGTDYFKYKSYLDKGKLSEIPADSLNSLETKVQQLKRK